MRGAVDFRAVDIAVFVIANLVNLLLTGLFLSRAEGWEGAETAFGLATVAMALPLGVAVILNIRGQREWWTIVLPLLLILFFAIELLFDYILKLDFRNNALLWPYLVIYYLGLMGMIGYSFQIGKPYGFVTLGTYFIGLLATWYGHAGPR